MRDLGDRKAADQAQRERNARFHRERGMTARQDLPELVNPA
jgi:hypothetical protein